MPAILEKVLSERLLFIFMPPKVEELLTEEVMLKPEKELAIGFSLFM
jgi:hypothetical protein